MQLAILLALCAFLFFYHLGDRDLWSSHEARAAQDAQSILDASEWSVPRLFDRKVELQKPPVYYWCVAVLAQLRGTPVDAWTVRLPAAGAALLSVLLVCGLGGWRGRPLAGFVAAVVLATAQHFTWLGRIGRIDMPLTLSVSAALFAYYIGHTRRRQFPGLRSWPWLFVAYVSAAAAVLLKGPIGIVLPAVVIAAHLLVEGVFSARPARGASEGADAPRWRLGLVGTCHEIGLWWGLPLVLALTVPLYLWANAQTDGAFGRVFFWYHNYERGLGESATLASHPWWFYGPHFLWDLLPWSPLLLVGAWWLWQNQQWRLDPEARFGLVWFLAMFTFLSWMRFKRSDYLLPAYPGAALVIGCVAERWWERKKEKGERRKDESVADSRALRVQPVSVAFFTLAFFVLPSCWLFYVDYTLPAQEPARERRSFAAEIRRLVPRPGSVKFFRVEDHALAFHLGPKIDTILEWENLDVWAGRPGTYVVMPPDYVREWPQHICSGRLEEVLRNTDLAGGHHEQPLVLLRTVPPAGRRDPQ